MLRSYQTNSLLLSTHTCYMLKVYWKSSLAGMSTCLREPQCPRQGPAHTHLLPWNMKLMGYNTKLNIRNVNPLPDQHRSQKLLLTTASIFSLFSINVKKTTTTMYNCLMWFELSLSVCSGRAHQHWGVGVVPQSGGGRTLPCGGHLVANW